MRRRFVLLLATTACTQAKQNGRAVRVELSSRDRTEGGKAVRVYEACSSHRLNDPKYGAAALKQIERAVSADGYAFDSQPHFWGHDSSRNCYVYMGRASKPL